MQDAEEVSRMQNPGDASAGGRGVAACIRMQQNGTLKQDIVNGTKDAFDPEKVKSLIQKE